MHRAKLLQEAPCGSFCQADMLDMRVCGAITFRTKHTGAAPQCLLAKAPKGTKNAFSHPSGGLDE